jgi:hypothetical protein
MQIEEAGNPVLSITILIVPEIQNWIIMETEHPHSFRKTGS